MPSPTSDGRPRRKERACAAKVLKHLEAGASRKLGSCKAPTSKPLFIDSRTRTSIQSLSCAISVVTRIALDILVAVLSFTCAPTGE